MEGTDNELTPEAALIKQADLMNEIRRATRRMQYSKFTLDAELVEEERTYTQIPGDHPLQQLIDNELSGEDQPSGKVGTLPPGALFKAPRKQRPFRKPEKPEMLAHDDLTEHLYRMLHIAGIEDGLVIATTDGAWVSSQTMDKLVAWAEAQATDKQSNAGAFQLAHQFSLLVDDRERMLGPGAH